MINYDAKMKEARLLIDQGLYTQAVMTLANVLENLYTDFYRQVLAALPPRERQALTQAEETFTRQGDRAAREQGFAGLTLGGKAKFYYENNIVQGAETALNAKFPHFKAFDPCLFNAIRIDSAHGADAVIDEDEANLFYQQIRVLLFETGRLQKKVEPRQESVSERVGLRSWKANGVIPHDDILQGNLELATYAADLWGVVWNDPNTPLVYRDPRQFYAQTYLTTALRRLLTDVLGVMAGGHGDRVLQLRTPFGGGKTHSLIALYHIARYRADLAHEDMLRDLPDPGECAVAAVQCEKLDARTGFWATEDLHINTLWGVIAYQLGGEEAYAYVQESDEYCTAPGGDTIRALLRDIGKPVLILLDEVLNYVEAAQTVEVGNSTLGRQIMLFLKNLTEEVKGTHNAALVYSLQASAGEAMGSSNLLAELDHLVSRVDAKREPVTGSEVVRVVQRRLFKDLGDERAIQQVAAAYADSYRRMQQAAGGQSTDEQHRAAQEADRMAERILESYPFHPDLLDLMYHRWGSLPSYQRTRGALQFLACVVFDLWNYGRDLQPLIGPGDVPLEFDNTRNAFFTQVGEREHYNSVLAADVTGQDARCKAVDARMASDSPALQGYRVGTRLATSAMLYSFGARDGEERGVSEADLLKSVAVPGLDRLSLTTALNDLRQQLLYLHYTGRRYRFETVPNLNKLIDEEKQRFDSDDVLNRVKTALTEALREAPGAIIWPESSARVNDRIPRLQVVYMPLNWSSLSDDELQEHLTEWLEYCGVTRREYKNGVAFVVPSYITADNAQKYALDLLAIESLIRDKRRFSFNDEQLCELNDRRAETLRSLTSSVNALYDQVAVPASAREEGIPYTWRILDLQSRGEASIHQRVIAALSDPYLLFDSVTADKLVALTYLSERQIIPLNQVVKEFYASLDFPRLIDADKLRDAISQGVEAGKLGYTTVYQVDDNNLYHFPNLDLVYVDRRLHREEIELAGSILLDAGVARRAIRVESDEEVVPRPPTTGFTGGAQPSFPDEMEPTPPPRGSEGPRRFYRLNIATDKGRAFRAFRAIQNLTERADRMTVQIQIQAESDQGFDALWLRNAVEEPLDEADIEMQTRLE